MNSQNHARTSSASSPKLADRPSEKRVYGFTMLEMMVAMVASAFLLAGLGSVMFIARQIAYSPTAAARRAKTADIVNQISDELRYATVITQQTSQILEFVVADRNNDGTAEKIRYEWSGTAGRSASQNSQRRNSRRCTHVGLRLCCHASAKSENDHLDHHHRLGRSRVDRRNTNVITSIYARHRHQQFLRPSKFTHCRLPAFLPTRFAGTARRSTSTANRMALLPKRSPSSCALRATRRNAHQQRRRLRSRSPNPRFQRPAVSTLSRFASPIRNLSFNRTYDLVFLQLARHRQGV